MQIVAAHTRLLSISLVALCLAGAATGATAHDPAKGAEAMPADAPMQGMGDMKMTGDADYDFIAMMKPHHQQALDMAEAELKNGKDKEAKAMARKIITAQKKEIAEFDSWMSRHPPSAK